MKRWTSIGFTGKRSYLSVFSWQGSVICALNTPEETVYRGVTSSDHRGYEIGEKTGEGDDVELSKPCS
jgi:hypothetical protein